MDQDHTKPYYLFKAIVHTTDKFVGRGYLELKPCIGEAIRIDGCTYLIHQVIHLTGDDRNSEQVDFIIQVQALPD